MFSRRDLLRGALAGAAAYVGSNALAGVRLDAAQRGMPTADLLLANGQVRRWPRRGRIGPDDQERTHRRHRRGAGARVRGAHDRPGRTYRRSRSVRCARALHARRRQSRLRGAPHRTRILDRRTAGGDRHARRRLSRRAPSSPASAAGTTRSSPRIDGRRRRSWTRRRRSTASTSRAPVAAPVRSRTASAARSSPREA